MTRTTTHPQKRRIASPLFACITLLSMSLFAAFASADHQVFYEENEPYDPSDVSLSLSVGNILLNPDQAYKEGVDDTATYIKATFTKRTPDSFVWGLGISGYLYDDNDPFTQTFHDCCGTYHEHSSASAFNAFAELGYSIDLSENLRFDLVGGYEGVLWSSRDIPDCFDCYSEKIDFDGGFYASPRLTYISDSGFIFGFSAQSYFDEDDVQDAYTFSLGFRY